MLQSSQQLNDVLRNDHWWITGRLRHMEHAPRNLAHSHYHPSPARV